MELPEQNAPQEARFSPGVAAKAAGIELPVLRNWHRRHGFLKTTSRQAGRHRSYDLADVLAIRVAKVLAERGLSVGGSTDVASEIRRDVLPKAAHGFSPWVAVGRIGGRFSFRPLPFAGEHPLELFDHFSDPVVFCLDLHPLVSRVIADLRKVQG